MVVWCGRGGRGGFGGVEMVGWWCGVCEVVWCGSLMVWLLCGYMW